MNHFKPKTELKTWVNFKLLDDNNKDITKEAPRQPWGYEGGYNCFSTITMSQVKPEVKNILVWHPLKHVPYTEHSIKRWLNHLNGLGFKNYYQGIKKDNVEIIVKLDDFTWKPHLNATLMLIRVLWESGMAVIPDAYFQVLDKNPKADRFEELQTAHKSVPQNFNGNHTVTSKSNGENISLETLMKRFEEQGVKVYGDVDPGQSIHWASKELWEKRKCVRLM